MLKDLENMWLWLDGKKTNIGAVLLFLSMIITQLVIGVNHYDPAWLERIVLNFNWVGGLLTAGGLTHQYIKGKADGN